MLQPSSISVSITTPTPPPPLGGTWPWRSHEQVSVALDAAGRATRLDAGRVLADPYQDEAPPTYRVPTDHRTWSAGVDLPARADLTAAVEQLRDDVAGLDWSSLTARPAHLTDAEHAVLHLRFAARPEGLDHLRPIEGADGIWHVRVQTSLDLLAQPALTPVVDAARAVLELARSAA